MTKLISALLIICLSMAFTGIINADECTDPVEIEELESICDYINAFDTVLDKMLTVINGEEPEKLTEEQIKELSRLKDFLIKLGDDAESRFGKNEEEAMKCEKFQIVDEKIQKVSPYLLHLMTGRVEEEQPQQAGN